MIKTKIKKDDFEKRPYIYLTDKMCKRILKLHVVNGSLVHYPSWNKSRINWLGWVS